MSLPPVNQSNHPSQSHPHHQPVNQLTFHTTPNYLTVVRICMVPGVILCLMQKTYWWDFSAAILFGIASATDYLDGYLARKMKSETVYGKLLDPLADKFLVICALIMLQELGRIHPIAVMLLVCRELTITGLRALASAEGVIVAASQGGKWKTALQMSAIPALMVRSLFGVDVYEVGLWVVYLSLALSLWSAKDYLVGFFKGLQISREKRKEKKRLKKLARQEKARIRRVAKL